MMPGKVTALKYTLLILCSIPVTLSPAVSRAERIRTEISSDSLEYIKDKGVYLLKGNVVLKRGDMVLVSDEAEYYEATTLAVMKGNIFYEDKDVTIKSESAAINMDAKTGDIHNAYIFIKEDNYHIRAAYIQKTGEKSYVLHEVRFTTCDAPLAAWCFSTSNADITVGDGLKAKNVVLRIKGVPLLYTPFIWAPILTERKTGLLFPEFGFKSDLGAFYTQPLFIVLSENRDATITGEYFSDRGFGQGLEYRYLERGGISGTWQWHHVGDRELHKDFHTVKASHRQYNPKGISHFLSLDLVNEKEYFQEYGVDVETRTRRFLESTASVSYAADPVRLYISGQYWDDLEFENDTISNKLPSVGLFLRPMPIGPVLFSLDVEGANFHSSGSHRVQRYSVSPGIHQSMGKTFHLDQTLKLREVYYGMTHTSDFPPDSERRVLDYHVAAGAYLFRRYTFFTHSIEPEIRYRYSTDSDYDAPLLDSLEAITELSDIAVSINNKLIDGGAMFFSFKINQPYNLYRTYHPLKPIEADLYLNTPVSFRLEASYDHYIRGLTILNGAAGLKRKSFSLYGGQRYDRETRTLFYTGDLGFDLTDKLHVINSIWYDARGEGVRDFKSSASYSAQCWGITLSYNQKPDDYNIMVTFELKGLGDFGVGMI